MLEITPPPGWQRGPGRSPWELTTTLATHVLTVTSSPVLLGRPGASSGGLSLNRGARPPCDNCLPPTRPPTRATSSMPPSTGSSPGARRRGRCLRGLSPSRGLEEEEEEEEAGGSGRDRDWHEATRPGPPALTTQHQVPVPPRQRDKPGRPGLPCRPSPCVTYGRLLCHRH